ncbi:hypothetical protein EV668_2382 [Enterovirga rhinocerotis]|uniref:MORN repeat protein n=1 Tax=Enterovirga rhinocerotis TaxID=1339210 RepID=A0A4R7BVJ9_9HYPH|nr:hypothetical protein EV668_2382 [Enterovirga rhinocerotis]
MIRAFQKFHRDGTIWARGQTIDDVPTGYWEWFRKDGTKLRTGYFLDGVQVGDWTTYDREGAVYKVTTMKPGGAQSPPPLIRTSPTGRSLSSGS